MNPPRGFLFFLSTCDQDNRILFESFIKIDQMKSMKQAAFEAIMIEPNYITGDTTNPIGQGNKIICHICNDIGLWGKGFVLALSKKWPAPEQQFLNWYKGRSNNSFGLGQVHFVNVEKFPDEIWVANMIGQHHVKSTKSDPPIRYEAVEMCLEKVRQKAISIGASIHMPRIGCGLAGGKWDKIEPILIRQLSSYDVPVFIYDFGPV